MADPLLEALPELIVLVQREGIVISCGGGQGVGLATPKDAQGLQLESMWPSAVADLLKQLVRKAIATRVPAEARFECEGRSLEARVNAQGPDRAVCVIRPTLASRHDESVDLTDEHPQAQLNKGIFLKRFKESVSVAALKEKRIALAVIHIDGLAEISQAIAAEIAEQVMYVALCRLPKADHNATPRRYIGQLGESLIGIVLESADRVVIEDYVKGVCASLCEPVEIGTTEFQLSAFAGVAIMGQDSSSPRSMLDNARSAATEARRSANSQPRFFSDTLKVRTLARLDIVRELRDAVANRDIDLRYVGRHELGSRRLVAWTGYLRWQHPLRGKIRSIELLKVAQATGLATLLSRAAFAKLRQDFAEYAPRWDDDVRIAFGPLSHHVLQKDFIEDVLKCIEPGGVPPDRLELRISEKAFVARPSSDFETLAALGVRLVIDGMGRGMASLDWLARAPVSGLVLDPAWVKAFRTDISARKVLSAGIAIADTLGLTAMASGVDDQALCDALQGLGCRQGIGKLFDLRFPYSMPETKLAAGI